MIRQCLAIVFAIAMLNTSTLAAPLPTATAPMIDDAIKRAVNYLFSKQNPNGDWELVEKRDATTRPYTQTGGQWGGRTALITYALLAADQSPQDPRIVKAVKFLRAADLVGTYAIAMRAQVWNNLPETPENKQSLARDMRLLLDLARQSGDAKGFYSYVNSVDTKNLYDHSASQYGVLGCWAAAENVPEFPPGYWPVVDNAWRADQLADGSWSYYKAPKSGYPATLSMTCAGVATLFITQDFLYRGKPAEAKGNPQDANVSRGLNWITKNFSYVFDNDKTKDPYYTLYGIERVALASGYKYFDTLNWYQAGADYLLSKQYKSAGSIGTIIDTSFALLFLSRGREPITFNKLQYDQNGKEGNWNQRPRDAANVTRWIGRQTERQLNWQIVNLKAPVEALHDAPILYLSGDQELMFNDEQKQKLRSFVEQGGLILAQADNASLRFSKGARALGSQLFPQYEFRTIPQDHCIFTDQLFPAAKFKKKPTLLGLTNGARELMIVLPDDPAKSWQPMQWRNHGDDFQLAADIFLYAIDKQNLLRRGESYLVAADTKVKAANAATIVRLQYDGNWDPEPGGWKRLANIMLNTSKVELQIKPIKPGHGKLKDQKIAHLTGTTQFTLDEAARKEIKEFVFAGGTLIVDAAGGNAEFAQSAESELDAIFGDDAKALRDPLPQDSVVYRFGGRPVEIGWRAHARNIVGALKGGRLRGMMIKNRLAVIESAEDLSTGLVGQPVDGINGYDPKTATTLMSNIILQAIATK